MKKGEISLHNKAEWKLRGNRNVAHYQKVHRQYMILISIKARFRWNLILNKPSKIAVSDERGHANGLN